MYKTRKFLNLRVSIHRSVLWNLCVLKHGDSKISVFYTRRFLNLRVQYTEIGKYEQFCLTKPLCFNTQRFLNLSVLKYGDSKISVFEPWRFLEHDNKILYKKILNINFNVSKLNLLRKKPIACHYIHW